MKTRFCIVCKTDKPENEFYPQYTKKSAVNWCKVCSSKRAKKFRYSDAGQKWFREYNQRPEQRDAQRKQVRKQRSTPEGKKKNAARSLAGYYLKTGRISRGECEYIYLGNCHGRIEMHHDDYSKPRDVRWLCSRHHRNVDHGNLP